VGGLVLMRLVVMTNANVADLLSTAAMQSAIIVLTANSKPAGNLAEQ
jgi:hypothetical protein